VLDPEGKPLSAGSAFEIDARMPHHQHGMVTQPICTTLAPGCFRIEGLQFHMLGRWELYFDVTRDGLTERAMEVVELQ